MKNKCKLKILLFLIISIFILTSTVVYARYVLNKTKTQTVTSVLTQEETSTVTINITPEQTIYKVDDTTAETTIEATISFANNEKIENIAYYYAWSSSEEEPESYETIQSTDIINNEYTVTESQSPGTYYLWSKVEYTDEFGITQTVTKQSEAISILVGAIEFSVSPEDTWISGEIEVTVSYTGQDFQKNKTVGYGASGSAAQSAVTSVEDSETSKVLTITTTDDSTIYVYAYAESDEGTSIYNIYSITNIDNTAPTIEEVEIGITTIYLTATDSKSGIVGYAITLNEVEPDDEKYKEVSTLSNTAITGLTADTDYYVWIKDAAGNVTHEKTTTSKVTYSKSPATEEYTNSNVTITFEGIENSTLKYKVDNGTLTEYEETGIEVNSNCTIYYYIYENDEQVSTDEIEITNIDKTAPVAKATSDYAAITLTATDTASGVSGYYVTSSTVSDTSEITFTSCENTKNLTQEITTDHYGIELEFNKTYTIYVKDAVGNISFTTVTSLIDTIKPTITITGQGNDTSYVYVYVEASDSESGINSNTYSYYISETENEFPETPEYTGEKTDYKFEGLYDETTYYVKVEVKDNAGNLGYCTTYQYVNELTYESGITFSLVEWTDNTATIDVTNSTNYDIEYQIGESQDESVTPDASAWSECTGEVTGLKHGQVLWVRLTDGTNQSVAYATYNVINEMEKNYPTLTESEYTSITYKNTEEAAYDVLTYSVNSEGTTVNISNTITNEYTYNYYVKDVSVEGYTFAKTTSIYDEELELNLDANGTYKIVCIALDLNGNIYKSNGYSVVITDEEIKEGEIDTANNRTYIDSENYTATIPAGFYVSSGEGEQTISTGLVIKDQDSNEFVWVPSLYTIYDESTTITNGTSSTAIYKPMVRYQSGSTKYYESLYYTISGTTSYISSSNLTSATYRLGGTGRIEPALITSSALDGYTWNVDSSLLVGTDYDGKSSYYKDVLGFSSATEMGKYLNSSYTSMVEGVDKFGGFYVGRYETTKNSDGAAGSKADTSIYNASTWYTLYYAQDSNLDSTNPYANSNSVTSTMITSSQYDQMLNFILGGEDKAKVTTKGLGNKTGVPTVSGQYDDDVLNNIYDLSGNVLEFTLGSQSYNYRVKRGGAADSSSTNAASTLSTTPMDSGTLTGSRMALYIGLTNDTNPPTVKIKEITPSATMLTVTAEATDAGTGVASYSFAYSLDGKEWSETVTQSSGTYTFTGLSALTDYVIRVCSTDNSGNTSKWVTENTATSTITLTTGDITIKTLYGTSGSGIALLETLEEYEEAGYSIKYQKQANGGEVEESGSWTTSDTVTDISDGDVIYATITDGSTDLNILTLNVSKLETYSDICDTTQLYTDDDQDTAWIPAGFSYGTSSINSDISNGLVIQDEEGNQFVWVPVDDVIWSSGTVSSEENYTPMVRYQDGSSKFYEMLWYTYSGTTSTATTAARVGISSSYREPTLLTYYYNLYTWDASTITIDNTKVAHDIKSNYYQDILNFDNYYEFGIYMNEEYTNMIESIQEYGGFYIARTETSVSGTTVQSQIGKTAYVSQNWYYYYYYQDSNRYKSNPYYNSTSVVSSMISGSQWNATLNWILQGKYSDLVTSETAGNRTTSVKTTGTSPTDYANNILDLSSNVRELTLTGNANRYREARGGYYGTVRTAAATSSEYSSQEAISGTAYTGSRMALYITKTSESEPEIEKVDDPVCTSGTVTVEINVTDTGNGIDKYHYWLSDTNNTDSDDKDYWGTENIGYSNEFTYTGLAQGTTYYLKVQVSDKAGNYSNTLSYTVITDYLEIKEGAIVLDSLYGSSGSGQAYFTINTSEEYGAMDDDCEIEYQVVTTGETPTDDKWTVGQDKTSSRGISNLSAGQTIYVRITTGASSSSYVYELNIKQLETYSTICETTQIYEDDDGDKAWIPAGFSYGTSSINSDISDGLVIQDEDGNQYVWVPVRNVIYDEDVGTYPTNATNGTTVDKDGNADESGTYGYKPMVKYQSGYDSTTEQYFEGIVYNSWSTSNKFGSYAQRTATTYALGNNSYREPSLVTGSSSQYSWINLAGIQGTQYDASSNYYNTILGFSSSDEFGEYLNAKYTEMVESVDNYKGFYVGRVETGYTGNTTTRVMTSKIGTTSSYIMQSINWYNLYKYQDSTMWENNPYYESKSVISSMISGSQYDAMLNWILEGNYSSKVTSIIGNHSGNRYASGAYADDYMNNILDLGSNVLEWTSEANGTANRVYRGGSFYWDHSVTTATRNYNNPTNTYSSLGSRVTLYLKVTSE